MLQTISQSTRWSSRFVASIVLAMAMIATRTLAAGPDAPPSVKTDGALRRLVDPLISGIGELLGLPRDEHERFLHALWEATRSSPAALVAEASRRLGVGDPTGARDAAIRARTILHNPLFASLPLKTRFAYWASASFFIGQSSRALGDSSTALVAFRDTIVLAKTAMRLDPGNTGMRGLLAASEVNLAGLRFEASDRPGAMQHFREAKAFIGALLDQDPKDRELQHMMAATDQALGDLLRRGGDSVGALAAFHEARAREALLADLDPNDAEAWLARARNDSAIGDLLEVSGDHGGAMLSYQGARSALSDFQGPASTQPAWRFALAESLAGIGTVQESMGGLSEAIDAYSEARDIFLALVSLPDNTLALRALGSTDFLRASVYEKHKEIDAAIDDYRDSIDVFTTLLGRDARDDDALRRLIAGYGRLAALQLTAGDQKAALSTYREAHDALVGKSARNDDPRVQRDLAYFSFQIGRLLAGRRDGAGALAALKESLRRFQAASASAPGDGELHRSVWTVGGDLGTLLQKRGDLVGALAAYRESATALLVTRDKAPRDPLVKRAVGVSADRIGSIGYLLLLERDFRRSLAAEEFALSLTPDAGWLVGNRAHALMFLGRTEEARAIYLGHRRDGYPDGKSWDDGTRADFAEMRKAGLHDPLMDEIEKTFAASR